MGDIEKMKLVILAPIIVALALITPTLAFAHTAAYWSGFNQEKRDLQNGGPEPPTDMCQSADFAGKDLDNCIAGANDAINGISP